MDGNGERMAQRIEFLYTKRKRGREGTMRGWMGLERG